MNRILDVRAVGEREIVMQRDFAAPRALVFRAYTEPALLQRWLGVFGGWTLPICTIDLRVGGAYRWVWRHVDGREMTVRGIYREILAPERIVCTERFDDAWYEGEALNTTSLIEIPGGTSLVVTLDYESAATRDAVLRSPMERGVAQSYENLAALVGKLS